MSTRSSSSETSSASARLLARQRAILQHLAHPGAFESTSRPSSEELRGIDLARLRVLGRLILAKRMAKIASLLPATCRCVSLHAPDLTRAFATARPPASLGRRDNAIQFHD